MRYSLRTLLILTIVGPPALAWALPPIATWLTTEPVLITEAWTHWDRRLSPEPPSAQ